MHNAVDISLDRGGTSQAFIFIARRKYKNPYNGRKYAEKLSHDFYKLQINHLFCNMRYKRITKVRLLFYKTILIRLKSRIKFNVV